MISTYGKQDISIWQKKWQCEKTNKQKFREKVMKNVSDPIRRLSFIVIAVIVLLNAGDDSATGGII